MDGSAENITQFKLSDWLVSSTRNIFVLRVAVCYQDVLLLTSTSVDPVDPGESEGLASVQHEARHLNYGRYYIIFKGSESILMAY